MEGVLAWVTHLDSLCYVFASVGSYVVINIVLKQCCYTICARGVIFWKQFHHLEIFQSQPKKKQKKTTKKKKQDVDDISSSFLTLTQTILFAVLRFAGWQG